MTRIRRIGGRILEETRRRTGIWFRVQGASLMVHLSWIVQPILLILIIVVQTIRIMTPIMTPIMPPQA